MFDPIITGHRLKALRIQSGRKQSDIASTLGIKQSAVSSQELGQSSPYAQAIYEYAEIYHVSADYILGLTDNPRRLYEQQKAPHQEESDPNIDPALAAEIQKMIDKSISEAMLNQENSSKSKSTNQEQITA